MLLEAGLVEGTDFDTVLLDGFDPAAHIAIEAIVGFPGWKSNETGQLERAGIPFDTFDPADLDIPGSFGAIYANEAFIADHPTAAEDFVRATMRGLADAVADPAAAANTAVGLINENGNPNFLSPEGEVFRWETEAALIADAAAGEPLATPSILLLQDELDAYAEIGLFGDEDEPPDAADFVDTDLVGSVYREDGTVIWPG
jgi:ABC-type nitrate/sulfonate/bicarbonate transport system substrate-binding protein